MTNNHIPQTLCLCTDWLCRV